ncbi:formylglycine-generating enzyme family protein [Lentilitoribacter sp. Alg239-R112]|uniref:formylglycine-generating enzyme family protein n=1 Tax=Lentilitoribacter sp. Alg239-R112 TaxID=2305987 RepID=UPI0013A6D093|nr:formylglycine-generating enzyme family protein [Lentilitoribacter sp. Alg239-R112]
MKSCCIPSRQSGSNTSADVRHSTLKKAQQGEANCANDIVDIPGGITLLGTNRPYFQNDGEGPLRHRKIKAFRMDATSVTNARFRAFVAETGYITEAEKLGDSLVFQGLLPKGTPPSRAVADAPWWRVIPGASWRNIYGPNTLDQLQDDHPVVHISWNDATAFAAWAGGRLPTELEWEHAARGGLGDVNFPWGEDEPNDVDFQPCNIWQGQFPQRDLGLDGYIGTAPCRSFEPNGYGLYNMIGNVWEFTSEVFKVRSLKKAAIAAHAGKVGFKLSKGGSFLCHRSYCYRYRIPARNNTSADTSTSHLGFRLVYNA